MQHLPQTELLARWRQSPDSGTLVALCTEVAISAERNPGAVSPDLALDIAREAEAHYAGDFEVLLAVGRMLLASGQLHRALKPLIEAARIASEPRALRFLGEVFLRLGDARHAAMAFERAVKKGGEDAETKGWLQSARGYLPLQEAHGAEFVAKQVQKAQEASRSGFAAEQGEVDDTTATHDLSFRRPLPSASEITSATGDSLPDLSGFDEDKTDVMSMSRVVAAIQHIPPAAREQFLAMMNRPASVATRQPTSEVDFDLDRDGLGAGEIVDELTDTNVATRQLQARPLSGLDDADDVETQAHRHALEPIAPPPPPEPPPPGPERRKAISGALAAAADRLKSGGRPVAGPIAPAGPLPATSNRIIPVALDSAPEPPLQAPPSAPPPAAPDPGPPLPPVVDAAPPVAARQAPKTKLSPQAPYVEAPARRAPVQVAVRRPKKKTKLGVAPILGIAVGTMLVTTAVGLRMGRLPWLAQHLPPWVSGAELASVAPGPSPDEAGAADEVEPEDAPSDDDRVTDTGAEIAPAPTQAAQLASAASASPEAPPPEASQAEPPPKAPPPKAPPVKAPPPKAPPPKAPPPKAPPPKAPPPDEPVKVPPPSAPAPDVVWLGDPELKVPD